MAVIIRSKEQDENQNIRLINHIRSLKPPTQADIRQAHQLDEFLESRMRDICEELKAHGFLERRQGDLSRWHALGTALNSFVDNSDIVPPEDRAQDRYIWIAIGQHAPDDLHPAKERGNSKNIGTHRDHFRLCYLLAKLQPDFQQATKQGTWRDWVTLLESKFIVQDERILYWIREKLDHYQGIKLRPLSKVLRQGLKNVHSEILSNSELEDYLEECWDSLIQSQ